MQKEIKASVGKVLREILWIGCGVQILLGIIWMCFHLGNLQQFAMPKSFLYRWFYKLTGQQAVVCYLLQLVMAGVSADYLLSSFWKTSKEKRMLGVLAVLTFPMSMQCHLALLPNSLVQSLTFFEWGIGIRKLQAGEKGYRRFFFLLLCVLLQTMLLPEYVLLGFSVLGVAFFSSGNFLEKKRGIKCSLFVLAAFLVFGTGAAAKEISGMENRSVAFALACRTVWPSLWSDHMGWPEQMQEALGEKIWETAYWSDNMDRIMKPMMEEAFDDRQADAYYWNIAKNSWTHRTSVILTQMRWDVLGYAAAPVMVRKQLLGACYEAYTGRNYEIMRNAHPVLTKWYVKYSDWWFFGYSIIAAILSLGELIWGKISKNKAVWFGLVLCGTTSGIMVVWYTLQGSGSMDYKLTTAVSSLWLVWALVMERLKKE